MTSRLHWLLLHLTRKLWFRASLFSVIAVGTALAGALASPYIPAELAAQLGANAVGNILDILGSSMLAVTIFSLSTMVSAYASATSSATPRAIQLLLADTTSQNTLAIFIGSFVFSLAGLIALSTGYYGEQGRLALFVVSLAVTVVIVVALLRWIDHVSRLGRVGDTTDRVEEAASAAMRSRRELPHLGGQPLRDPGQDIPGDARTIRSRCIGYVQHIDMGALQELAGSHHGQLFLCVLPGAFVDHSRALAHGLGMPANDKVDASVCKAFTIQDTRSFDQDPRFGASVLSEIASRALSPAINDPGTAIDVIGRAVRLLSIWSEPVEPRAVDYPLVHVPGIALIDLFDDLFTPIARDGAAVVEVGIRLQKGLRALVHLDGPRYAHAARHHSRLACERAMAVLRIEHDKALIRALAEEIAGSPVA
ncbi:DUF2254 domain-containing protein [Luteimonas sp. MC1782]|uniref:DUF2254 domain-containing protein n=1 Tax=Luteimonas sp. MC1782 TaxID=2760305 RepID=UPI001602AAF3|nr:DUF2254 domain-containing protein [Luteimonas sp. MC1782]MBB1472010.1 DUF2254 domain-containing protein [Luteimonas sp. MC1782]